MREAYQPVANPVKRKNNYKGLNNISEKSGKIRRDSVEPNFIIIPEPTTLVGYGEVNVEENGCGEEIIVCNNPPIQQFDDEGVGIIENLKFSTPWSWIDPSTGTTKNTDAGEGCKEGDENSDIGLTFVMDRIGTHSNITPEVVYELSEDVIVTACLDESDTNKPLWRFKVKNVRVPIFSDICATFISNRILIDLGDANDFSLLSNSIKNCSDFKKVLEDLNSWIIGVYTFPCLPNHFKYVFNKGINVHEGKHNSDIIFYVKDKLNTKVFAQIKNEYSRVKNDEIKCSEDALNIPYFGDVTWAGAIRKYLLAPNIHDGGDIKTIEGTQPVLCLPGIDPSFFLQYTSEIKADNAARETYREIRGRILSWGKLQDWYDPTDFECIGIN